MALSDLGISQAQEDLYRLLSERPTLSMLELRQSVSLPQDEVRAALDGLLGFGLALPAPEYAAGIRLVNALVGLGQLIECVEDRLVQQQRRVADARAVALDLASIQARTAVTEPSSSIDVERIQELGQVRERLEELSFFARDSVFAVQPGGPQPKAALDAGRPLDRRSIRRGLTIRVIYEQSVLDDEFNRAYLLELTTGGAQVHVSKTKLERLIVIDSNVAMVPVDPAHSGRGVLVVREPGLLTNIVKVFEHVWSDSDPVPWAGRTEDNGIDGEDRQILTLLAAGCTDETAARQMGVSVRHLRRRVARLMALLEASSRFEAGAEAAHRRWI